MTQNVPAGKQTFVDVNGKPLAGGFIYTYLVGTTTPFTTYKDSALTITNTNPIVLDARGMCSMYANGNHRQILQDATTVQIWDQVVLDSAANVLASIPAKPNSLLNVQVFTTNGIYTPTTGIKNAYMKYCGGGGGSGFASATTSTQNAASGGAAAGSYGESFLSAAQIGATRSITIGIGGTAGNASVPGGSGGTTQMDSIIICPGGGGSTGGLPVAVTTGLMTVGGLPGATPSGTIGANIFGMSGEAGSPGLAILGAMTANGGSGPLGSGGNSAGAFASGSGYGAGAGGRVNGPSSPAINGFSGGNGIFIIYEYS